jgi:glycosyltransferase involved in cell wall biosynthesis
MAESGDAWVVIPAYNEAGKIADVVADVLQVFPDVVVVDDGSADDTALRARAAGASVVVHPINLGQGAALQTGIDHALAHGAQWLITLDADGQHDPGEARAMLAQAQREQIDVVLGSRFLGTTVGMTRRRWLLLKVALLFQTLTTRMRLTDVHNGLRVLSAAAARRIRLRQNRMAHASELVSIIRRERLRYREFPVTIHYTDYSKAKGQGALGALNILTDLLLGRLTR